MKKHIYPLEELQEALSKNEEGDDSALEFLIDKVFDGYEPSTFHKIYTEEYATNKYKSHQECYSQFKLILIGKFFESITTTKPKYQSFFKSENLRPYKNFVDAMDIVSSKTGYELLKIDPAETPELEVTRLSVIVDHIIKYIIHGADKFYFALLKILNKYPDIMGAKHFAHLLNFARRACAINIKLNNNQKELLKKYDIIHPSKWIQIDFNADNKIVMKDDPHYERYFRSLNDETILQMYLLGEPFVSIIEYKEISGSIVKDDTQYQFDAFVYWFWKFAQTKKEKRIIPDRLKSFCIEILQIVSEVSNGTKYSKQTFPLNNPDKAWYIFKAARANAKKRLQGSFDFIDRIFLLDLSE